MMRVCSKDFRRKILCHHFSYGSFKLWSFKACMTLKIICYTSYFFENAIQLTLILFSPHCSSLPLSDLHLLPTLSPFLISFIPFMIIENFIHYLKHKKWIFLTIGFNSRPRSKNLTLSFLISEKWLTLGVIDLINFSWKEDKIIKSCIR